MSKDLTSFLLAIATIIGFFILGLGIGGYWMWTKWNKSKIEYQQKIQDNQAEYEQQLKDLTLYKDSLENQINTISTTIDSLNTSITSRTEALDSIKQEYDEQIDDINNMSHNELVNFFSNRY